MPLKYNYKAKDSTGKTKSGVVEAINPQQAVKALQDNKLLVIELNEKKEWKLNILGNSVNKVSAQDIAQFTRLLATMLNTGLPLTEALGNLAVQSTNEKFKDVIKSLLVDVQGGQTMSISMSRFPDIFNNLYLSLVKAGETSGKVDDALAKLADTLESQIEFKAKIKGALLYPLIIVVAMTGIGILMITTVIPKIADVYKEFGAELPLPTRILMSFANFLTNYTIIALLIIAVVIFVWNTLRKNKATDLLISNALLNFPIFGPMSQESELAILNRTLATLVGAGVGIVDSLKVTCGTLGNNYFREGLTQAASDVQKGIPLSQSLRGVPEFPIMVSQLISIGEETGTLDQSLMRLADFFQNSAERKVKTLTTALEPMLILIMGTAVGGLAIAVLLPMFNLVNVIK